jgi:3-oxoacyl-[acyl-carrier-protein] synthase II
VRTIERFDPTPFHSHVAAQIDDFRADDFLTTKQAKRLDRFSQFSVVAAQQALNDARLDLASENHDRIGAMMGTALGGVASGEAEMETFVRDGLRAVNTMLALTVFGGASSCNIAIEFGVTGPNSTNAMSCSSGAIAIGDAFHQIRDGYADVMIAGGAEAPLSPLCFGAFSLIRAMSTRNDTPETASRPFDRDRDGFVMGEGSAVLILEEYTRARARGAPLYAEIRGYGTTNDAYHMTAPRPDGSQAARAMQLALDDAHVHPEDIDYINAHGSSTPLNDPAETLAIKRIFADRAYAIPISGTKGYYGHALGASGAFEAAICALAISHEWLPPTLNLTNPDPRCDLNYLPSRGIAARVDHVLSNSFGFGGINAALLFCRVR